MSFERWDERLHRWDEANSVYILPEMYVQKNLWKDEEENIITSQHENMTQNNRKYK